MREAPAPPVRRAERRPQARSHPHLTVPSIQGRRRPIWLAVTGVVVLSTLAMLRNTAPPEQGTNPATGSDTPAPTRYTPSPSQPPRGNLPRPTIVDPSGNRIVGNLALVGAMPGEDSIRVEVDAILDWYCPESKEHSFTIRQLDGYRSVEVSTRPHPSVPIPLELRWTGSSYRWSGPYEELTNCW